MKRHMLIFLVVLLLTLALAVPAFAAIHPIVESECAAQDSQGGGGQERNPPGQTENDGPGDGHGDLKGPTNANGNATKGQGSDHCENN